MRANPSWADETICDRGRQNSANRRLARVRRKRPPASLRCPSSIGADVMLRSCCDTSRSSAANACNGKIKCHENPARCRLWCLKSQPRSQDRTNARERTREEAKRRRAAESRDLRLLVSTHLYLYSLSLFSISILYSLSLFSILYSLFPISLLSRRG